MSTLPSAKAAHSEPDYARSDVDGTAAKPWWNESIEGYLTPKTRKLLEEYSHVPSDQVLRHVHDIREKAWKIRSYPCTGVGSWLIPNIDKSPAYGSILERLRDGGGGKLLDVGSFLGHDLRCLTFDGVPSTSLYALDIVSHWEVGYELFRDRDRFHAHFLEADLLDERQPELAGWVAAAAAAGGGGSAFDVVAVFHVLHQWTWPDQVLACRRLVALLSAAPGSMVVGCQVGNVRAHDVAEDTGGKVRQFRHTPESFAALWDEVGEATGSGWKTEATLCTGSEWGWPENDNDWLEEGWRVINFVVTRVT